MINHNENEDENETSELLWKVLSCSATHESTGIYHVYY